MTDFKVVIPARLASTRLPGKPLLDIAGKPMIVHVCERALEAGGEVLVATDHESIAEAVSALNVKAVMTRVDHASGTERLCEVAQIMEWPEDTRIINLQGDEPLMDPELIHVLAEALEQDSVATLSAPIIRPDELFDPNVVKVICDSRGHALYFSRAPIPWDRDHFQKSRDSLPTEANHRRHIGIYAYKSGFLSRYTRWTRSPLEGVEALEQLRILWHGEKIRVIETDKAPESGVDTEADLQRIRKLLQ